jgi:hypothetical protein
LGQADWPEVARGGEMATGRTLLAQTRDALLQTIIALFARHVE